MAPDHAAAIEIHGCAYQSYLILHASILQQYDLGCLHDVAQTAFSHLVGMPFPSGTTVTITSIANSRLMYIGSNGVLITYTCIVTPKPSPSQKSLSSLLWSLACAQAVWLTYVHVSVLQL